MTAFNSVGHISLRYYYINRCQATSCRSSLNHLQSHTVAIESARVLNVWMQFPELWSWDLEVVPSLLQDENTNVSVKLTPSSQYLVQFQTEYFALCTMMNCWLRHVLTVMPTSAYLSGLQLLTHQGNVSLLLCCSKTQAFIWGGDNMASEMFSKLGTSKLFLSLVVPFFKWLRSKCAHTDLCQNAWFLALTWI